MVLAMRAASCGSGLSTVTLRMRELRTCSERTVLRKTFSTSSRLSLLSLFNAGSRSLLQLSLMRSTHLPMPASGSASAVADSAAAGSASRASPASTLRRELSSRSSRNSSITRSASTRLFNSSSWVPMPVRSSRSAPLSSSWPNFTTDAARLSTCSVVAAWYRGVRMKLTSRAASNPASATDSSSHLCLTTMRHKSRRSITSSSSASFCGPCHGWPNP